MLMRRTCSPGSSFQWALPNGSQIYSVGGVRTGTNTVDCFEVLCNTKMGNYNVCD